MPWEATRFSAFREFIDHLVSYVGSDRIKRATERRDMRHAMSDIGNAHGGDLIEMLLGVAS